MPTGGYFQLPEKDDADIDTPPAGYVNLFLDDIVGPAYKDDAAAVHSFVGADGELDYTDHGNTGSTETLDFGTNIHRGVLNAATVTLSFSGAPASGTPAIMRFRAIQDATGGRLLAYPGSVVWVTNNGSPPVLSTAANGVDVIDFETEDGGTTVYGYHRNALGPAGGAIAIEYTFSTTTTDADPGAGNLRLSNATQTSATAIRADLVDAYGTTWTSVIDSLDDSTNTVKGHIRLFKTGDLSKWLVFTVSAVGAESGYRNITVTNVAGSASSPLANGDRITLVFTRSGDAGSAGAPGSGNPNTCDGRLTLTSGTPVTTGDVTAATTLYFTPYKGSLIGTYSGSAWSVNSFTEKSITLASLTAGLPYDCFIVDGTLALELTAWTNTTTRATALTTQDGILVKTGATTRRYLGTICIVATGESEDSVARRMVWNYYNRVERPMFVTDATDNWTYATATWRAANGTLTNHQVEFVVGVAEDAVDAQLGVRAGFSSGVAGSIGIGLSSTSAPATGSVFIDYSSGATESVNLTASYHGIPAVGYGFLSWLEYTRSSTITFYGDSGIPTSSKSTLTAEIRA